MRRENETTVEDGYTVTLPGVVREAADIEVGDKIRWVVDGSGSLSIEVVRERKGAFTDLDPIETETETNAVDEHDRVPEFEQ